MNTTSPTSHPIKTYTHVIESFPQVGFVRLPQILSIFPVSKSTWWAGVKSGKYPKSIKLGAQTTAWRADEIIKLVNELSREG